MLGAALLLAGEDTYSITNSARFNGTSDYLSKTLTTSATTSGSIWVKRSKLGATSPIFDNKVYFTSGDALYAFGLTSTALYRDPSAWYHIFWNGTGVYVNGTLVTGTGTYTAASVTNPRLGFDGTNYFSGYLSDFAFWNGSSASLQGGISDSNGVWSAKRPSAGYSFLAFGSSGALGTDTSGNGNNWTVSGSPVQTVDTPTCSFPTFNPIDHNGGGFGSGNLVYTLSGTGTLGRDYLRATQGFSSGSWEWQMTIGASGSPTAFVGIADATSRMDQGFATRCYLYGYAGNKYTANGSGGVSGSAYGAAHAVGDVIKIRYSSGSLEFFRNGSSQGVAFTGLQDGTTWMPYFANDGGDASCTFDFGQISFSPAATYAKLCTANLSSIAVTTSGTFTGNANADGPFVWTNGNPATLTINGNAVTFGTHADKTAGGFKLRTSSASYNTSGSNTWTATAGKRFVYSATSINNAQGNP